MSAEKRVAEALLQEPTSVTLGGKEYKVPPPSTGTIVKVSEIVSQYPEFEIPDKFSAALAKAKDYAFAPDVMAVLILGSRKINEPATEMKKVTETTTETVVEKRLGFIKVEKQVERQETKEVEVTIDGMTKYDQLRDVLMHDASTSEVYAAMVEILNNRMETSFFFQNITFLRGLSMTKPTKTTAPGQ